MDIPATQMFEDDDFTSTQKVLHSVNDEELQQVGVLHIGSNTFAINRGINKVGRHPACNIVINDQTVSKVHAEIEADARQVSAWICDMNSSNKTKLNNSVLRAGRCYELKDESIIEFGRVQAIFKVYRPLDDSVIPQTPAASRQKTVQPIIPGTPDSSLNNSSAIGGEDVSMIPSTQDNVFRRPALPQQRNSGGSYKSLIHESSLDDSAEHARNFSVQGKENVGETSVVSIYDMETQHEMESQNETELDIHDVETQKISLKAISGLRKPIVETSTQSDIHNLETQHDADDVDGQNVETQENKTDACRAEIQKNESDIHDVETQGNETDIHDVETQHDIDIHNVATPKRIRNVPNIEARTDDNCEEVKEQAETTINEKQGGNSKQMDGIEIHGIEVRMCDTVPRKSHVDDAASNSDENNVGNVCNKIATTTIQDTTEHSEITEQAQKCSQEFLTLSLASSFEEEYSELEQSGNITGSQNLLKSFIGNDEHLERPKSRTSTPTKSFCSKTGNESNEKSSDDENIFDAATQVKDDDENIFDAVTQRVFHKDKPLIVDDDSETDEEGVFQYYSRCDKKGDDEKSKKNPVSDSEGSDTDAEGHFMQTLINYKGAPSSSTEVKPNEITEIINDPGMSGDSVDLFDVPTQCITAVDKDASDTSLNDPRTNISNKVSDAHKQDISEIRDSTKEGPIEMEITDLVPTQILPGHQSRNSNNNSVRNDVESDEKEDEDITEMEDNTPTQILSNPVLPSESESHDLLEQPDPDLDKDVAEDIDYQMAPTQPIADLELQREKKSTSSTSKKKLEQSKKLNELNTVNLNDTVERNLNDMFDDINEGHIEDLPRLSTQTLENVLQSSQSNSDLSIVKSNADSEISANTVKMSTRGRRSKVSTGNPVLQVSFDSTAEKSKRTKESTDTDSQNSENYFSNLTSTRKSNVLQDSQPNPDTAKSANTSNLTKTRRSNIKKTDTDSDSQNSEKYFSNLVSTRKNRVIADSQSHSTDIMTPPVFNETGKTVGETYKSGNDKEIENSKTNVSASITDNHTQHTNTDTPTRKRATKNVSTPRSLKKNKINESKKEETIPQETTTSNKAITDAEKDFANENNDRLTCSSRYSEYLPPTSNILDDDDDFFAGLPAVKISGTLSNPPSPTSSVSTDIKLNVVSYESKRAARKTATRKSTANNAKKPSRKVASRKNVVDDEPYRVISNAQSLPRNVSTSFSGNHDVDYVSAKVNESDEGEINFKGFEPSVTKTFTEDSRKRSTNTRRSLAEQYSVPSSTSTKYTRKSPSLQSNRRTRNCSKENVDQSSVFQVEKEAPTGNASNKTVKGKMLNASQTGKRSLSVTDEIQHNDTKKRKAEEVNTQSTNKIKRGTRTTSKGRQSANILDFLTTKTNSPANLEMTDTTTSSKNHVTTYIPSVSLVRMSQSTVTKLTDDNPVKEEVEVKRNLRTNANSSVNSTGKDAISKGKKSLNLLEKSTNDKSITRRKAVKNVLSDVGEESQEVEMIMKNVLTKDQSMHIEIEKKNVDRNSMESTTRRTRKRANAKSSAETDTTESSMSSDICESDNSQFEVPKSKAKRAKISKNNTVNESITEVKKESKKSSRSTRSSQRSATDASIEDTVDNEQNTTKNVVKEASKPRGRPRKTVGRSKTVKTVNGESLIEESTSSERDASMQATSIITTPTRARRSMSSSFLGMSSPFKVKPKILFTGVSGNDYTKTLVKVGASQVEDPAKCTVLVTDKVRRTVKFLCALGRSVPIVSINWLNECEKVGQFVDFENYILKDPAAEMKFGFKLKGSLDKAKNVKLLEGYTVILTPNLTAPPLSDLKSIITSCGGKPLVKPPSSWPEKAVIISSTEDLAYAKKFLTKAPKSVSVQSTEFILTGILRQELNFTQYKLT